MLQNLNKSNDCPLHIRDQDNADIITEDPLLIKQKQIVYWLNIRKNNYIEESKVSEQLANLASMLPSPTALCTASFDEASESNH